MNSGPSENSGEIKSQAVIFDALPAQIALLDLQGVITSVNESWRQFGDANSPHSPGHAIGTNYLSVCDGVVGDDALIARRAAAGIRSVLAGKSSTFSLEYPCHSPTVRRWFVLTATPLANGHAFGAVVMHVNITERVLAEEAVRRQQVELRTLFDLVPAMIWFKDTQNRILRVNQRVADAAGRPIEAIEGKPSAEIYPQDAAKFYADDLQVIESAVPRLGIVETLPGPDGHDRWVQTDKVPYFDQDGKVVGIVVMARDITRSKQAESDLRESEARFRQMAEAIDDVFFLREADTSEVLYISPAYEEIWGRSRASLYQNPESWAEAIHPEDRARAIEGYERGMSAKSAFDFRIVRPDGTLRWIHSERFPVRDGTGKVARVTGVAKDVTQRKLAEQELLASERRFNDMLGNVQLAAVMLDREGRITYCNDYLLSLSGWTREEVMGRDWFETFMPAELGDMKPVFQSLLANLPEAWHVENELFTRSRERRMVRWNNSVLRSAGGEVIGVASIGEDITEQKQDEIRIKYLNRVYAVLSGINTLIVRVRDRDELFREACRIAIEAGGFRMAMIAIVDHAANRIVPIASAGMDERTLAKVRHLLSSGESAPDAMVARAIREKRTVISNDSQGDPQVLLGPEHAGSGIRSIAIFPLLVSGEAMGALVLYAGEREFFHAEEINLLTELTGDIAFAIDHIDKGDKLNYLAYYDAITGFANQALFLERLQEKLLSAEDDQRKKAVFVLDIERFKSINDAFGRKAGDELLKLIAERLVQAGGGDAKRFARLGADRFAIVASGMDSVEQVGRYVEQRMDATFRAPFQVGDNDLRVFVKVGIAMFPDDGADADTLLRHAEAALKKAKGTGDRYLFYTQKMTERVAERLSLENRLRHALEKEQFVLHYQPKVSFASGLLTGGEALIRWNDPETGLVPPMQFIPILEETGLIHEIGRWALRKAIEDYLRWRNAGLPAVRIAVNVSPLQLRNRGFIAEIQDVIGVDPQAADGLELEITESLIMEDVKHSIASLQAIRAMGVTVAIDDFGTGFSSLSYLSKLPVDTLKIDRSFIIDMTGAPAGLSLVSTIINLSHSMKLKVVAEGVETEEQSRLLRLLRCDEMQGYLFSKPVPADVFEPKFLMPLATGVPSQ